MLQVADENAVVSSRPFKFGAGDGLRGVKDTTRSAFGRPPAFGKPPALPNLQPSKSQVQTKPRIALGDLTNALKRTAFAPAKPMQPCARNVSEPPIESLAGKCWQVMEDDMLQQAETELQQRLDRVAVAASSWTTSHLYHEELGSDDESESDASICEPFSETPIVVQLLVPRRGQGIAVQQPGSGFDNDLYNLLPDVSPVSIDFDMCWADDEA